MNAKQLGWGMVLVALAGLGCSDQSGTQTTADNGAAKETDSSGKSTAKGTAKQGAHAHGQGPNGGVVFDLGKYHAEFTVDHPAKECTVLFVTGDSKDAQPLPVAATELSLNIKETKVKEGADQGKVVAPMTLTLKPVDAQDGKAAKFVGTDPGISNVADFAGTVIGEIDGKPSQGTFEE